MNNQTPPSNQTQNDKQLQDFEKELERELALGIIKAYEEKHIPASQIRPISKALLEVIRNNNDFDTLFSKLEKLIKENNWLFLEEPLKKTKIMAYELKNAEIINKLKTIINQ